MMLNELSAAFQLACERGRAAWDTFEQSHRDDAFAIYDQEMMEVDLECSRLAEVGAAQGFTIEEITGLLWVR